MDIGIPREIKPQEYRVAVTPAGVAAYVGDGHRVLVERGAGEGAGFADADYEAAGAVLVDGADAVWGRAEMVIKVKEPVPSEYRYLRPGLLLFGYLHLAAAPDLAEVLRSRAVSAVAYETITGSRGALPCLAPMSAIAGRLSVQVGARFLERPAGGRGVLLAGVPGVPRGRVVIIGGGTAGAHAAIMAAGLGADVVVLDVSPAKLDALDGRLFGRIQTLHSSEASIAECLTQADLVVGAVLVPGASAPKLIRRAHLRSMPSGAVLVDVAVDQGGCAETTRPTTHDNPTFVVDGVTHYCVTNMPAAVSRTATAALAAVTLPYGRKLAALGVDDAISEVPELLAGLNIHSGRVVHRAVKEALLA